MSMLGPSAKWLAKKAARRAVAAASSLTAAAGPSARVLMYHRFGPADRDLFTVDAGEFEAQLRWLVETGTAVSLDALRGFVHGRESLPEGAALVSIDDGDATVWDVALPLLRNYRVPAVLFAIAGSIGRPGFISAGQLRELAASGVAIGSHTVNHLSLAKLSAEDARRELVDSRRRLEDVLGLAVSAFAYPYGTRADISADVDALIAEAGYDIAFTTVYGPVRPGMAPISLPRIKVENGDGMWLFRRLCRGGLDRWQAIRDREGARG